MGDALLKILILLLFDAVFIGIGCVLLWPLLAYRRAATAVLKRNFVGYFSNPTGYVFLCLFVLLTSFAAFWPHEFFTANLANLDQLNRYLPYIMLVFIPAVTMSIWADERRQGTDELLLTLPATDFDIVMGKYLAAAAIFTFSLVFSQLSNYAVLSMLTYGNVDTGLFFATYFGYWLVGLSMLSIGMVASFLTGNLTVGFILGAAFNAPLAFAANADVIIPSTHLARAVSFWSLASHFDDLGRGVISSSSILYFLLVATVGLYLSMVLIGSRHWSGGRDGHSMLGHYLVRTLSLLIVVVSMVVIVANHDFLRRDITLGGVSSLSPKTRELIKELKSDHQITIEAFVSAQVPELYVQTRYNLVSLLKEFDAMSGGKINVKLHDDLEPFSDEATIAEQRFGIKPTLVRTRTRGAFKDEQIILGAAFSSGLEKVVVPFFDYGVPVEYELIRSIGTVARGERKKVGVLRTDAQLFGGFSFAGGMPRQMPKQEIIEELQKQYDVEEVDATNPIEVGKYAVLLAVQPSSLAPEQFTNFVEAVKAGQPTAIFEDPMPVFLSTAPGTGDPKQAPGGGMFGGGGGPQPKGDIKELWKALGIESPGEPSMMGGFNPDLAWQRYNPYPKLQIQGIPDAWIFASNEAPGSDNAINSNDPITAGLSEILFPVPGTIEAASEGNLKFTPLVKTGDFAGTISVEKFRGSQEDPARLIAEEGRPRGEQILAARIQSKPESAQKPAEAGKAKDGGGKEDPAAKKADEKAKDAEKAEAAKKDEKKDDGKKDDAKKDAKKDDAKKDGDKPAAEPRPINVVYVADIDLMINAFLRIRARPDEDEEITWRFENVNFLLNIIDALSGDSQYVEIRRRKPHHSTLRVVEEMTRSARGKEFEERITFEDKFNKAIKDAEEENKKALKDFQSRVDELKKKQQEGQDVNLADVNTAAQQLAIKQQELSQKLDVKREALQRERNESIEKTRRETDLQILKIQNRFKFWAVAIPPIPPMIVGLIVFVVRRLREREGVAKSRLR
jgi:ABC-2 type transport system permease protein